MSDQVRTRFAPSPTGFMHVGGVRTALFAWLFARGNDGQFVLRIEDTDKNREVEGSVDHIIESLAWLGIEPDEGPKKGGEFGPYLQSERLELYRGYVQRLIDAGLAYADPFTPEQVDEFRKKAQAEKRPFLFRDYRPEGDLSVPEDWYQNVSIRLKTTELKRYTWHDVVRGELSAGEEALDDFILMKADGYPTYNFAHVIDDHEMQITHVIRGEEFIPSVPKYLSLMDALDIEPPIFATAPPILNMNGGKKLSKRDGAQDVLEYRDQGFDPDTIVNFLASLGWNDGTEKEIFTTDELVDAFSLERMQKSGAKFDQTKLDWMAWQHDAQLIEQDPGSYLEKLDVPEEQRNEDFATLAATKSRSREDFKQQYGIYTMESAVHLASFDLSHVDKKLDLDTAQTYLRETIEALGNLEDFNVETVEATLRGKMEELGAAPRAYLNLIRWIVSNSKVSPNLFEMIAIIGKDRILQRLQSAL